MFIRFENIYHRQKIIFEHIEYLKSVYYIFEFPEWYLDFHHLCATRSHSELTCDHISQMGRGRRFAGTWGPPFWTSKRRLQRQFCSKSRRFWGFSMPQILVSEFRWLWLSQIFQDSSFMMYSN